MGDIAESGIETSLAASRTASNLIPGHGGLRTGSTALLGAALFSADYRPIPGLFTPALS